MDKHYEYYAVNAKGDAACEQIADLFWKLDQDVKKVLGPQGAGGFEFGLMRQTLGVACNYAKAAVQNVGDFKNQ